MLIEIKGIIVSVPIIVSVTIIKTMFTAYMEEINSYKECLKEGKHWDTLDTNYAWIHNKINNRMYENGVGISQVQEDAHQVRLDIQAHLEKFNPLK